MDQISFMRSAADTYSIPEVGRMLGVGKVQSYWIVENRQLKTIVVCGHVRVLKTAFWDWYDNQVRYQMVDGTPAGTKLKAMSYSVEELAKELGVAESQIYRLIQRGELKTFTVDTVMRIAKEDFNAWYTGQNHYRNTADRRQDEALRATTYSQTEMAKMLGVHRNNIYSLLQNQKHQSQLEIVTVGDQKRVTKDSFEAWVAKYPRYQNRFQPLPEPKPKPIPKPPKPSAHKRKPPKLFQAVPIEEAAKLLQISRKEIYQRVKNKTLYATREGNTFLIHMKIPKEGD